MRIAFLNIWGADSAEAHTGIAMKAVAKRIGAELVPCRNSAEAEACNPDFALVFSRTQAKLTRCPTYLVINEPASVYLREPGLFNALYTFDGYFAVADTLMRFLNNALYGVGRKEEIGFYYNTAPRFEPDSAPVKKALFDGTAKLTYFGTNWDGRRNQFFRQLSPDDVALYGPRPKWEPKNIPAYKGEIAYDGLSVFEVYRQNGIGLNIQGDHHVKEDVISNRVFEISAAGAVCISCYMPWLEKHFGDSLYYFDQEISDKRLLEEVQRILEHIKLHPQEAWEKAQKARKIFEEKFTLEILLQNTIDYHNARQKRLASRARDDQPLVSVVICSSGENPAALKRAIASVVGQETGRFHVILVKTAPFTPEKISAPHVQVETVDAEPGKTPLWQGLARAKGDYVAVIDEVCEWFPQHINRLLDCAKGNNASFVHSALVREGRGVAAETAWINNNEHRRITHQMDTRGKDFKIAADIINQSGFLAAKSLFDERLMDDPGLGDAAVEYLVMALMARAKPVQNFAATVLLHESEGGLKSLPPSERMEVMLRLWRENPHTGAGNTFLEELPAIGFRMRAWRFETERSERNGVMCDDVKSPRFDRARLQPIPIPFVREQSFFHMGLTLTNDKTFAMHIMTGETQRGLAGFIAFPQMEDATQWPTEYLVVVEAEVEKGQFGVQLLHNQRTLERYAVARSFAEGKKYRLEIPVYYRPEVSGLVIEVSPSTNAHIRSITAYAEM